MSLDIINGQLKNKERAEFYRYVRAIDNNIISSTEDCIAVTKAIISSWLKNKNPDLKYPGDFLKVIDIGSDLVDTFVNWLCHMEILNAAYWISSAYSIWRGAEHRKSYAMYFTPPILTKKMLDDLQEQGASFSKHSFFDPACGGAAFLVPIAKRMMEDLYLESRNPLDILKHVEENLIGTDLDPILCEMSKIFLNCVLSKEIISENYYPSWRIFSKNSLTSIEDMYGTMDIVICNPPYRKLLTDEIIVYGENFSNVMQNQANLYCLFMALCLNLVKNNGIISLITPMSFLSGKSFSKLRHFISNNSKIIKIGIISERSGVFIDVEQETSITIFKKSNSENFLEQKVQVSIINNACKDVLVGSARLDKNGLIWAIPREKNDVHLLENAFLSNFRISDYGYTARIGAFVWNRDKRSTFFSELEAKDQLAENPFPLLWSSDIKQGGVVQFQSKFKKLNEPLFVEIEHGSHRSIVKRSSVLLQRVTSNDQSRRLIAARVPNRIFDDFGGFIGENHVVILESGNEKPLVSPKILVKLLSSNKIDRIFRCISSATNVSLFELNQLPLPSPLLLLENLRLGLDMSEAIEASFLCMVGSNNLKSD
jgi:hypothetical protein